MSVAPVQALHLLAVMIGTIGSVPRGSRHDYWIQNAKTLSRHRGAVVVLADPESPPNSRIRRTRQIRKAERAARRAIRTCSKTSSPRSFAA